MSWEIHVFWVAKIIPGITIKSPNGPIWLPFGWWLGKEKEAQETAKLIAASQDMKESLKVMTELCRIKYGNLDTEVYKEIEKAQEILNSLE